MYKLVLTKGDRDAIDWVGGRYSTGNDLRKLLITCEYEGEGEWDEPGDIMFDIPEHTAWEIKELIDEETNGGRTSIPCFDRSLSEKLWEFVDKIV